MKKLFVILSILTLVIAFSSPALACEGPQCGPVTADGSYSGDAYDSDLSRSGWGNDIAGSFAEGHAGGTVETYANAEDIKILWFKIPGFAYETGSLNGNVDPKTWAWHKDTGYESKAGAGAKVESSADSFGFAEGLAGCKEYVSSNLGVNGYVDQFNSAAELGYGAGEIRGGNNSAASFAGGDADYDSGRGLAIDYNSTSGEAFTKGNTIVSIDPYGSHRSISGYTENMGRVEGSHLDKSNVFGAGGLGGSISSSNGSFAGGNASFSYNGNTYGSGNAGLDANVSNGSVSVSGNSQATGN